MTPDTAPSPHSLATASGLLLGALAAAMALGALIGWALGSAGLGLLIGAIVGIPLGALVVYQVYGRGRTHEHRHVLDAASAAEPARADARRRDDHRARAPDLRGRRLAAAGLGARRGSLGRVRDLRAVLTRLPDSPDNLAAAGMRGIGTTSRALLVGIVLVIVTVSNETVGLAAAILYAIAFTAELGVGLATYFGSEAKT